MTRKKFIKHLRSIGTSEKTIKDFIKVIAKFGGKLSYQSAYDALQEQILEQLLKKLPPTQIDYRNELLDFNFDTDYYQYKMHPYYGVKPLDCGVVVNFKVV